MYEVRLGDCLDVMRGMDANSVDSVVTDPPYHLVSIVKRFGSENAAPAKVGQTGAYARASRGFMGKVWDGGDLAFQPELWAEVLRVLKPGGHLVSFSGTRTYHRMACAIEDAGFEIRDQIGWTYGSGFPKSHDISKAIEAKLLTGGSAPTNLRKRDMGSDYRPHALAGTEGYGVSRGGGIGKDTDRDYKSAPPITTPEAQQWQGWGTALKPAWEPICLARKPLAEKSVAANVLAHGTGAINIDGCRVGTEVRFAAFTSLAPCHGNKLGEAGTAEARRGTQGEPQRYEGRFPANLIHDGSPEVLALFPNSNGQQGNVRGTEKSHTGDENTHCYGKFDRVPFAARGDSGSAARFFYCAKASRKERGEGNDHPTVKPTDLMRYLCALVTPPGGLVLDPFAGSGSTGLGALLGGFRFLGIEQDEGYAAIARKRVGALYAELGLDLV